MALDHLIAQLERDLALAQRRLADPTDKHWELVTMSLPHARYVLKTWPKKIAAARRNAPIHDAIAKVQP
jgi:hypothetical protein